MIKIFLTVKDKKIRNIEALREIFFTQEFWEFYNDTRLEKWLMLRNYNEEYDKIKSLSQDLTLEEKIKAVSKIFKVESFDSDLAQSIEYFKAIKERENHIKYYNENKECLNKIVTEYKAGALSNSEDLSRLSEHIKETDKAFSASNNKYSKTENSNKENILKSETNQSISQKQKNRKKLY